ncbi:MAG: metal-dependent transcriptional regulator [Bacilli bacterium]
MNANGESKIQSSEDYLEKILMLSKELDNVRAIDLAKDLNYSKPSISIALKKLVDEEYVTIDEKGSIYLTINGREIAEKVYAKHLLLSSFLIAIGVERDIAVEEACAIEHHLSDKSFEALKTFYENNIKDNN